MNKTSPVRTSARALLLALFWLIGLASISGCGGGGDSSAGVTPSIVAESGSQSATAGGVAIFSVTANDARSYQWQTYTGTTWTNVAGANASSYTLSPLTLAMDAAQYRVVVTGSSGSVTSSVFILTVTPPQSSPVITTQPMDQVVLVGQTATISVVASGTAPTYAWQVSADGGATWATIGSATAAALSLPNVALADNGKRYRVIVSNGAGATTSSSALLSVTSSVVAPTIAAQPANQSANPGQSVTLSVSAVGTTLTYQWQSSPDVTTWTAVAGATGATLTLTAVTLADNGKSFRVVVSNSAGSATSSAAVVTVTAAVVAPSITTQPIDQSVTVGQNTSMLVVAAGTALGYQWQASIDGGTNWANVSGGSTAALPLSNVALSDNGKRFRAVVSNSADSVNSNSALLTVSPATTVPVITAQPVGQSRIVGQTAGISVSVAANGIAPTYAWEFSVDGNAPWTPIGGAAGPTLTLGSVAITDNQRRYRVKVSNSAGTVTSGAAVLAVAWGSVTTSTDLSSLETVYGGGGDGGTAGGGDGAGADGGGGLGKTLNALMTVTRIADGALVGQALTDATTGLVKIKAGPGAGPFLLTLSGNANATYYDEGKDALLPFGPDQTLHALVDQFDENVGVSAFTEAAYLYALNNLVNDPAPVAAGTAPLRTSGPVIGLTLAQVQTANGVVLTEINRTLQSAVGLASIKSLPTPIGSNSSNTSLSLSRYGIAAAITGGFTISALGYQSTSSSPALDAVKQLARDLTDGKLNGFALDGNPAAPGSNISYDAVNFPPSINAGQYSLSRKFGINSTYNIGSGVVNKSLWTASRGLQCSNTVNLLTVLKDHSLSQNSYNYQLSTENTCVLSPGNPVLTPNIASNVALVKGNDLITYVAHDDGSVAILRGDTGCGITGFPQTTSNLSRITSISVVKSSPGGRVGAMATARDSTGSVYAWGAEPLGLGSSAVYDPQIPGNPFRCASVPQKIPNLNDIVSVAAVDLDSDSGEERPVVSAISANGVLYKWGYIGSPIRLSSTPVVIDGISGVVSIAVNPVCDLILKNDGTTWIYGTFCLGIQRQGGGFNIVSPLEVPSKVQGLKDIVEVASDGGRTAIALQSTGVVFGFRRYNSLIDAPTFIMGGMIIDPQPILTPAQPILVCKDYSPGIPGIITSRCNVSLLLQPAPRIIHIDADGTSLFADDGNIYRLESGYIALISRSSS